MYEDIRDRWLRQPFKDVHPQKEDGGLCVGAKLWKKSPMWVDVANWQGKMGQRCVRDGHTTPQHRAAAYEAIAGCNPEALQGSWFKWLSEDC
uniref:Uncharacterized protein n=1 Tax=Knipowitschia caucasica TaxID=637954 RepID=A0AAV2JVU3_KNICA